MVVFHDMKQLIILLMASIFLVAGIAPVQAQAPVIWVFGRNAGLDFNSALPAPVTYNIDNCYSPTAVQCDDRGNLLFYCDGRTIRDKNGQVLPGSANPIWPAPIHMTRVIKSHIVPDASDTNRFYVFMLSPSSGVAPFGTYYSGALTYSIVDMRLNNGDGGVDPAFSNILLHTELDMAMLAVPASDCGYWLIAYQKVRNDSKFVAFRISDQGISSPVYSTATIPGFPYPLGNMNMSYAYRQHKIVADISTRILAMLDFDEQTGVVGNGRSILDLAAFRSPGGGAAPPSFCLSPDERFLYLLGYVNVTPLVKLQQYPVDLSDPNLTLSASNTIFQTTDPQYQIPAIYLPLATQACDMRIGPDHKIYLFYNTGQSFLGQIRSPNNTGMACDFSPQGIRLLPDTYGSFYFPAMENKRIRQEVYYRRHDTSLCITEPVTLRPIVDAGISYSFVWNDGSTTFEKKVREPGTYWVTSNAGCSKPLLTDTFRVSAEPAEKCNCALFVPNAFSPNRDAINDIFMPRIAFICIGGGYYMKIYNRWGETVFQSYDITKGWDGNIREQPADAGVYHYAIRYRDNKGKDQAGKGTLTLLR